MTTTRQLFAVSTGRSGSKSLAQALTQVDGCTCLHEPHPRLVELSARYRYGTATHDEVVGELRRTRPVVDDVVYGETANRLALVLGPLRDAFPAARFLHLVRDGRSYVASQLQRGAFGWRDVDTTSPWSRWRLRGDLAGEVPEDRWSAWDAHARLCWQWAAVNRWILDEAPDAHLFRIEELPERLPALVEELGLGPATIVVGRSNRRRGPDEPDDDTARDPARHRVRRVVSWEDWNEAQRRTFEELCGPTMDALYPGWRGADGGWLPTPVPIDEGDDLRQILVGADAVERSPVVAEQQLRIAELTVAYHEERTGREELERRTDPANVLTDRLPQTARYAARDLRRAWERRR